MFQSSFELTGYITSISEPESNVFDEVSKLFRAYGLYNSLIIHLSANPVSSFKALSSLRVI